MNYRLNVPVAKREEFVHHIQQRSKDLLNIVNDIRDISNIETGQMTFAPSVGNMLELLNQLFKEFLVKINLLHHKSIDVKDSDELKEIQNIIIAEFIWPLKVQYGKRSTFIVQLTAVLEKQDLILHN
jgi:signal transduction histidine kinase